jgi:uncharacterized Zn finger protein
MPRESAEAKGRRYLVEGRVVVEAVDPKRIVASVRGNGAMHTVRYEPGGWSCDCPASGRCSHLVAVGLVTVAPVVRRLEAAS